MSTATALRAERLTPKLLSVLREGYGLARLKTDIVAGLNVAVVALPLSMALGVASGATPDQGLITAIVGGFLISAFGGSRVQIGGPTGAFVVVIAGVIHQHGYAGLLVATLLAGLIMIAAGFAGLGQIIRYVPRPVITGFTAGIAVIIATSQVGDLLGLHLANAPADVPGRWAAYAHAIGTLNPWAAALGVGALALIVLLRRVAPMLPGYLIALVIAAGIAVVVGMPIETIGSRFPGMSFGLPVPSVPALSLAGIRDVFPSAFTIAFLGGIEALLSATVADGMTGFRHRPDQELIGQGIANIGSALFGGLPATGALARTASNVRSGGRTPLAGMLHSVFLLIAVVLGAHLILFVPMTALAAILLVVSWGMAEADQVVRLLRMPMSERALLVLTFLLTVFLDLTVAIGVGVTLASLMFAARMSKMVALTDGTAAHVEEEFLPEEPAQRDALPAGVEVFQMRGPLFFGAAADLLDAFRRIGQFPRVFIIRMRLVPYLDASALGVIEQFVARAEAEGCRIILSGVQPQPAAMLARAGLDERAGRVLFAPDYAAALALSGRVEA